MITTTALAAAALVACGGGDDGDDGNMPALGDTVAITATGRVVSFDRAAPATYATSVRVKGLAAGEAMLGIDVRPSDGKLYVVTNLARIYTLDAATGSTTLKSTIVATAGDDEPYAGLVGASFGVDFNPVADRLRVVGSTGQNLRINVDTGAAITDGTINGAPAAITASGYTNSFAGTTTTQLYAIDAAAGTLYLQNPPNDGTLSTPLPIGVSGAVSNGFDVDARNNTALAALTVGGATRLYTVSLSTGTTTVVGTIGSGSDTLIGMALLQTTRPTAVALTADSRLARFDPSAPNTITSSVAISGLGSGESVLGIDVRPANGRLYALTSLGRVLVVDATTGTSSLASTLVADTTDATDPFTGLTAGIYSVDFNPVADRLRVVTSAGANLRINVDTGATTTDGVINRAAAATVVGAAYTNSYASPASTRLFDLDAVQDVLAEQTPPNNGTLVNVGTGLGIDLVGGSPVDIGGGDNGLVLAALRNSTTGPFSLYTVSLTSGVATLYRNTGAAVLSQIGGASGPAIVDLAILF